MNDISEHQHRETVPFRELVGKKVTDIFSTTKFNEEYALYFGDCVVVLDEHLIIQMPNSYSDDALITVIPDEGVSEFADLSDFPVYNYNMLQTLKLTESDFNKIIEQHFSENIPLPERFRHVVTFHEKRGKYLQNRIITDFIRYTEADPDDAFFELDNGYLFGQVTCTQPGTGYPCVRVYDSLAAVEKRYGKEYVRLG